MIDKDLVKIVKKNFRKGFKQVYVRNMLLAEGYSSVDVQDTIDHVKSLSKKKPKKPGFSFEFIKKIFKFIGVVLGIILLVFFILFVNKITDKTVTEEKLEEGSLVKLNENIPIKFIFNGTEHTIKANKVRATYVELTIKSEPVKIKMRLDEEKKVDINGDGDFDLEIKLKEIKDRTTKVFIKKVHKEVCSVNWTCGEWGECESSGVKTRVCTDSNSCEKDEGKPEENLECNYSEVCTDNLDCTDWSDCVGGRQSRSCIDLNDCTGEGGAIEMFQDCAN